jgi:anaerobic selenocysteine-containing dehydrogenase
LNREYQSERKLFPNGLVEMSGEDADALGVRPGWRVRLSSAHGAAVVPVRLRKDLQHGVLLAPYWFRDWLADVLGEDGVAAVNVERA